MECKSHDGGNLMIISYDKEAVVCTVQLVRFLCSTNALIYGNDDWPVVEWRDSVAVQPLNMVCNKIKN